MTDSLSDMLQKVDNHYEMPLLIHILLVKFTVGGLMPKGDYYKVLLLQPYIIEHMKIFLI